VPLVEEAEDAAKPVAEAAVLKTSEESAKLERLKH
jgi:hypothetical protein